MFYIDEYCVVAYTVFYGHYKHHCFHFSLSNLHMTQLITYSSILNNTRIIGDLNNQRKTHIKTLTGEQEAENF